MFSKSQGFVIKPQLITQENRNYPLCRAEAAAAGGAASSDGHQPLYVENKSPPKFLGTEILTLKNILPLGLMFLCILFNYTILRDTKDVLVVTAKGSSAEIIPFFKTWVNLPMAVGFMLLYTKLANVLLKDALFYTVMLPFIAFFRCVWVCVVSSQPLFSPHCFGYKLLNILGPRFLGSLAIMRIWSFCLFYVMAELWGSVAVSVLFWGFANQQKPKMGTMESLKFLVSKRYIRDLATLVVAYGISINLVEVTWKSTLKAQLMFLCILFNYTILRDTKDVLVVTARGSSAEIIPFFKTWVNLPMAVGFMLLYTKLANVLLKDALFYTPLFSPHCFG
ncbi:hypothetical protein OROGR_011930 [Orobanche gracilis]